MKLNPRTMRWEILDRDGNVVGWISDEVPPEGRAAWYANVVLKPILAAAGLHSKTGGAGSSVRPPTPLRRE